MAKIYCIDLADEERDHLLKLIKSGQRSARKMNRAQILLLADEGKTDPEIAEALHTSRPTVQRIRKRFVEGGLNDALNERSRIGGRLRKKLDEKGLAVLETLARSQPPAGRQRWTMQLLADRLVELQIVDRISDETVRKECKKRGLSLG
jgi:transposase